MMLPEGKSGKAAALSVLALVVATAYFAVLAPVLSLYVSNAQTLEQRREILRRDRNAVSDLPRLRALAKERAGEARDNELLLNGASDATAAAELQAALKDMIEENGAKISSAATLTPEAAGEFRRVGIRVASSGDLQVLTSVLLGIEAARPIFRLGNLDLHVAGIADESGENPSLDFALDVFGYRVK
jgi:hypothetical protein